MASEDQHGEDRIQRLVRCGKVFSPAAPIDRRDLFAGRLRQLERAVNAVHTRGQHAVVFGERGVGKTSLANIVRDFLLGDEEAPRTLGVKVNCSKNDDFVTVWRKALGEIRIDEDTGQATLGFRPEPVAEIKTAANLLPPSPSPNDVRRVVEALGFSVIIFDEFDRLRAQETQSLFADTIKEFSDAAIRSTLILVGVADDIDELISEHASIDRALCQILMPRMARAELEEIVQKALGELEMEVEQEALDLIVLLSQGLPHYTHLLGKAAARAAIQEDRTGVCLADVKTGIDSALEDTHQNVRNAYQQATASPRRDTLFKEVLLACALAPVDDLGFFASADVREPLSAIMGKPYDIPGYSQHLDKFSSEDRGNVLEKAGTTRRFRFRFSNPLLQPFVIMRGLADGILTGNAIRLLQRKARDR